MEKIFLGNSKKVRDSAEKAGWLEDVAEMRLKELYHLRGLDKCEKKRDQFGGVPGVSLFLTRRSPVVP